MKILLLGNKGLLGNSLENCIKNNHIEFSSLDYPDIDARSPVLLPLYDYENIEYVINCIAYTDFNKAELDYKEAFDINVTFVKAVADYCNIIGASLCQISSSYVFDGEKLEPYAEDDHTNPLSIYGLSKIAGEIIVRQSSNKNLIIRTSDLFGINGVGKRNIVDRFAEMLKNNTDIYAVVDETTSPTYVNTLSKQIISLIKNQKIGTYHATSTDQCDWVEFLQYLKQWFPDSKSRIIPVKSAYFQGASKPKYRVLSKAKLIKERLCLMQMWQDDLREYLES